MLKEVMDQLSVKFDDRYIKQRKGNFGKTLDYIEGDKIIQRANDVLRGNWSIKVLTDPKDAIVNDSIIIKVQLSFPEILGKDKEGNYVLGNMIVREHFGGKKITLRTGSKDPLDLASDFKSSTTDAIKKVLTTLGIALDLYGTDEKEKEEKEEPKVVVDENKPAQPAQIQAIGRLVDVKKKVLKDILAPYKVTSADQLKEHQAKDVIVALNRA